MTNVLQQQQKQVQTTNQVGHHNKWAYVLQKHKEMAQN